MKETRILVAVGSKNPAKIEAVEAAFRMFFPGREIKATGWSQPSGVDAQPKSEHETLLGALNRAMGLVSDLEVDYYVGMEGGIVVRRFMGSIWHETRAAVVVRDAKGESAVGWSAAMQLPKEVAFHVFESGMELRDAAREVYGDAIDAQGIFAHLSKGLVTRSGAYRDAILFALGSLAAEDDALGTPQ